MSSTTTANVVNTGAEVAAGPLASPRPVSDPLTMGRLLTLVVGISLALSVFKPDELRKVDDFRTLATAVCIGLSLPSPLFTIPRVWRGVRLRAGALLWLALGLGAWLMMPPAIDGSQDAKMCLLIAMPLASLWYMLAAWAGGRLRRRSISRLAPWPERFGFYVGGIWSPLGIWWLYDVYSSMF